MHVHNINETPNTKLNRRTVDGTSHTYIYIYIHICIYNTVDYSPFLRQPGQSLPENGKLAAELGSLELGRSPSVNLRVLTSSPVCSKPGIKMVDPELCKEIQSRISAAVFGWDCPLLTFIYPGFDWFSFHLLVLFLDAYCPLPRKA